MQNVKSCEDRRYLFDISREDVLDMTVAQHSGVREAMAMKDMKFLGVSSFVTSQIESPYNSVVVIMPHHILTLVSKKCNVPCCMCGGVVVCRVELRI